MEGRAASGVVRAESGDSMRHGRVELALLTLHYWDRPTFPAPSQPARFPGYPRRAAVISAFSRNVNDAPHCVQQ